MEWVKLSGPWGTLLVKLLHCVDVISKNFQNQNKSRTAQEKKIDDHDARRIRKRT